MFTHPLRELELDPAQADRTSTAATRTCSTGSTTPGDGEAPPLSAIHVERIGVIADFGYYALLTLTVLGVVVLGRAFWGSPIGRIVGDLVR